MEETQGKFCLALVLACALATAASVSAHAASRIGVNVEPIVGYERSQKLVPTAHTKDRLIYGARLSIGIPLLAVEATYTRGTDTEEFPGQALSSIKDTDDKLKVGLRSSVRMSRIFSIQGRGGVQAKRNIHEETLNGVSTKTTHPIVYDPYAGLGLSMGLARNLTLTGGMTVVFNEFPKMNKNEYETTLGFSVRFP